MVVIRCTQNLLRRMGPARPPTVKSTAKLGDWSANLLGVGHGRLVLFVSEPTRLPVLVRATDVQNLARNFSGMLAPVLDGLWLSETPIIIPFGGESPKQLTRRLLA